MGARWPCDAGTCPSGTGAGHWPCTVTVAVAVAVSGPGTAPCRPHVCPLRMRSARAWRLQIPAGAAAAAHAWGGLSPAAILKSEPQAGRRRGRSILGGGGGRRSGGACEGGGQPGVRGSPGEGGQ